MERHSTAGLVTPHTSSVCCLCLQPRLLTDIAWLIEWGRGITLLLRSENAYTFANFSLGSFDVMIGSIVLLLPNVASGMYNAQITCAHPNTCVIERGWDYLSLNTNFKRSHLLNQFSSRLLPSSGTTHTAVHKHSTHVFILQSIRISSF